MKSALDMEPAQAIQPQWTKLLVLDLCLHPWLLLILMRIFLPLRNTKNGAIRKMSCERSIFDGTFSSIKVIDILVF